MDLVNSTAEVQDEKRLIDGLKVIFEDRLIDDLSKEKLDITDLLKVKNISLNQSADTWEEAIEKKQKLQRLDISVVSAFLLSEKSYIQWGTQKYS